MIKFVENDAKKQLKKLGYNLEKLPFSLKDFTTGMNIELEHGTKDKQTNVSDDDPLTTAKITLAHLKESKNYYKELTNMENKLEEKKAKDFYKDAIEKVAKTI